MDRPVASSAVYHSKRWLPHLQQVCIAHYDEELLCTGDRHVEPVPGHQQSAKRDCRETVPLPLIEEPHIRSPIVRQEPRPRPDTAHDGDPKLSTLICLTQASTSTPSNGTVKPTSTFPTSTRPNPAKRRRALVLHTCSRHGVMTAISFCLIFGRSESRVRTISTTAEISPLLYHDYWSQHLSAS